MRVFVASAFSNREQARSARDSLRVGGIEVTSTWHDVEDGNGTVADWFQSLPKEAVAEINRKNDADLQRAHLMLMIGHPDGGESYAEAERARAMGIGVVWTGKPTTSIVRDGVLYAHDLDRALVAVFAVAKSAKKPWDVEDEWLREHALSALTERVVDAA